MANTLASGASARKGLEVRLLSWASSPPHARRHRSARFIPRSPVRQTLAVASATCWSGFRTRVQGTKGQFKCVLVYGALRETTAALGQRQRAKGGLAQPGQRALHHAAGPVRRGANYPVHHILAYGPGPLGAFLGPAFNRKQILREGKGADCGSPGRRPESRRANRRLLREGRLALRRGREVGRPHEVAGTQRLPAAGCFRVCYWQSARPQGILPAPSWRAATAALSALPCSWRARP